jgi:hypothetical protein
MCEVVVSGVPVWIWYVVFIMSYILCGGLTTYCFVRWTEEPIAQDVQVVIGVLWPLAVVFSVIALLPARLAQKHKRN